MLIIGMYLLREGIKKNNPPCCHWGKVTLKELSEGDGHSISLLLSKQRYLLMVLFKWWLWSGGGFSSLSGLLYGVVFSRWLRGLDHLFAALSLVIYGPSKSLLHFYVLGIFF